MMVRGRRAAWPGFMTLLAVSALLAAGGAGAATAKKSTKPASTGGRGSSQSRTIEAQRALIDSQLVMIAKQTAMIERQRVLADSQAVRIGSQQARLDTMQRSLEEMRRRLEALESQANFPAWEDSLEARVRKVEAATQKSPELPPDVVSAGNFPGSIRIPGSDAAIKFGARVRTAAVFTLDPLGTDDRFLTNSIPVGGTTSGEAKRTNISARASRLNMEFRTPAGVQEVRAFFEGDFAGTTTGATNGRPVDSFRLRHAYAQYRGFIVGQTWSTFSDPNINLEDLDFEGVSSENIIRQPQLRYWWAHEGKRIAFAVETPAVSITGGTGVNLFPDVIGRVFKDLRNEGHLQIAGVLRQIRGESIAGDVRSAWAGGGTLSGVLAVAAAKHLDRVMFQVNGGNGIARYINDLQSLGGQDAVFDTTTGDLKPLPVLGWYVGYEHRWKEWERVQKMNLRSTVLWSRVVVDNYDFQPADAYHLTDRIAGNLVFSPSGRVDVGVEYIHGIRNNKDGQHASANQVQLVGLFRF